MPMSRDPTKTGKIASREHEWSLVWVLLNEHLVSCQVLPIPLASFLDNFDPLNSLIAVHVVYVVVQ